MHGQFTPMSSSTVQFAKNHRSEQIRETRRSRPATNYRTAWFSGRRVRSAYDAVMALLRRTELPVAPERSARPASPAQ